MKYNTRPSLLVYEANNKTYVLYQLFKTLLGMIALPPIIGDDALRMVEKHLEKPLGGTETCGDVAFVRAAATGWLSCCFNTSFWIVDRIMLGRKNNIFLKYDNRIYYSPIIDVNTIYVYIWIEFYPAKQKVCLPLRLCCYMLVCV
jgi:hypothetical protein